MFAGGFVGRRLQKPLSDLFVIFIEISNCEQILPRQVSWRKPRWEALALDITYSFGAGEKDPMPSCVRDDDE